MDGNTDRPGRCRVAPGRERTGAVRGRGPQPGRRDRSRLQERATDAAEQEARLRERVESLAAPERARLRTELSEAKASLAEVKAEHEAHRYFRIDHPEAALRRDYLHEQIAEAAWDLDLERQGRDGIAPEPGRHRQVAGIEWKTQSLAPERSSDLDLGL